jgi:hypothetical protein
MYFKWLVAHRKPFAIIWQSIKHTLVPEGQDMYQRYLQCDDHVFGGILMYSHWNIPVDRLCLLLSKLCGYNTSARFKALDVGRRDENSPLIRSMHVECSAKDKAKVQQFLEAYYNTQSPRTFMLGIKLRFIPLLHESDGIGGHDKTMRLYNQQAEFNNMLQWSNIFSLKDAHIIDSRSKRSINDCIMDLKCRDSGKQLFHSLDQPFGPGTHYNLSFISAYQAEATEVLNTLPAYLVHWNGTWIYKYFKSEDVAKARNCYWDKKSRSIRLTKEKTMDYLMMWDTEWHSQVEITNLEEVVDPENPAVKNFTGSVDSVSTIQLYKDTYKDNISVTLEDLSPPNTVCLNSLDSGASLMSFAESAAMQSYKPEVEAVTEKVNNIQAEMRAMKAGIY